MFSGWSSEEVVASDLKKKKVEERRSMKSVKRRKQERGQKPQSLQCKQGKTSHPKGFLFKFCHWIKDRILCSLISASSSIKEFDFKPSSEERAPERWIFSLLKSIILGSHILKNQLQLLKSGVNVKRCLHSSRNNTDRCWLINCKSNQPSKDRHRFNGSERNLDRSCSATETNTDFTRKEMQQTRSPTIAT